MEIENDRAAFYEAHRDDNDLWDDPAPAPIDEQPARAGLTATITVRFSAEEAEVIRQIARTRRSSYSDVVREAVAQYTRRGPRTVTTVHLFSGGSTQPRSEGTNAHLHRAGNTMPNSTGVLVPEVCA